MTASIRAPRRALALAIAFAAAALPGAARADLVVLSDGAHYKVASYELDGDSLRVALAGGGRVTLPIERVERVVADEVIEPEAAAELAAPSAFSPLFDEAQEQPATPYAESIYASARRSGLNPSLVAAVVRAESSFDARAVSRKGARGLMQIMPATGRRLGLQPSELYEPQKNLEAGARYLRQLLDRFGAVDLALAAYNAGEGAVERHGGMPPYRETVEYVRRIYAALGLTAASALPAAAPGT